MPWETTKGPGNRIGGRLAGLFVSAEYTEAAMLEEESHRQRVAKFSPKLGKNHTTTTNGQTANDFDERTGCFSLAFPIAIFRQAKG